MGFFKVLIFFVGIKVASGITYEYMDLNCGSTITVYNNMRLLLTSRSTYSPSMDCYVIVQASDSFNQLMFFFKDFNIEPSSFCDMDWLEARDGNYSTSNYVYGLLGVQCGFYMRSSTVYMTGRSLYLRFKSDKTFQYKGFDMVITSYHTGFCYSYEYKCGNGRCISNSLTCNGYNPCGDFTDCTAVVLATGAKAGIAVGCIFFVAFVTILIIICRRRRMAYVRRPMQPSSVNVVTSSTGYNQPAPAQYPAFPPPSYPVGPQHPPPQQQQQY